ncbi:acyltransferase family protein [Streptomyces sp. NPDC049879]|uniref:acyltransferase family protein n=1 Tax=Streptomyces sp. NPDC049879 TaxID=3365598 RepID=UPI003797277D
MLRQQRDIAGPAAKPRDPQWENVRYIAAATVLVGHAITPLRDQFPFMHWLYNASWQLGVPAFALISGRFSSALPLTGRAAGRLVTGIALPYVAVSLVTSIQLWAIDREWHFSLVEPAATLWFLLSLIFWKMALPYVVTLRWPLAISVLLALTVGFAEDIGYPFSASQTITFFPFFYLGHLLREREGFAAAVAAVPRWAAALVTAALAGGAWLLNDRLSPEWLAMKRPYSAEDFAFARGVPIRAAILLWGVIAVLALVRLVPRRHVPLMTSLGTAGMYIYILHPLVLTHFHNIDFFARIDTDAEALAVLAVAVASTVVLGSRPVQALTRPLVQPRGRWLLRPPERLPDAADGRGGTPPPPRSPAASPAAPQGAGPASRSG